MDAPPPLFGRDSELQIIRSSLDLATEGRGTLLLLSGLAGMGKTRLIEEASAEAHSRGFTVGVGAALAESSVLYHPWNEALRSLGLEQLLRDEPPPRLLALYLVSAAGLPVGRSERPGFGEDPALLSMMINNAADFLRDAIKVRGGEGEGDLMRFAVGGRGVCVLRARNVGLLAVYEGRESEIFLYEMRRLLEDVSRRAGARLDGWDGNKRAVADLTQPLTTVMQSGAFEGVDLAADGQARKYNLFDNVLFGLRRRAATSPVMLAVDDLQSADASSIGLLHYLARNSRDAPIFLLGAYRAEEGEGKAYMREALAAMSREDLGQEITLPRLSPRDTRALAEAELGAHKIEPEFFEKLTAQIEGNPFILREVLVQMKESGAIAADPNDGLLRVTRPLDRLEVPGKIRDAVLVRVDALERGDRELIDAAAVCGTRFPGKLLAGVLDESELKVARKLGSINRHHRIILPAEANWRFEHPIVREVVYELIPNDLRRLLHLEAGKTLLQLGGAASEIGEHLAEGGDARAVEPLEKVGTEALERGSADEAARLFGKASKVAPPEKRGPLELRRAQALERADRHDEALSAAARALQLGANATECALLRAVVLLLISKNEEALAVVEDSMAAASPADTPRLLVVRARALNGLARFVEAEAAATQAVAAFPEADLAGRSEALFQIGSGRWYRGAHAEASEVLNEALALRERADDKRGIAEIFMALGALLGDQGRLQRSVELLSLALSLSEKIGDRRQAAGARLNMANALVDIGDLQAAQQAVEKAEAASERVANPRLIAWCECIQAMILDRRGKYRDAAAAFERAAAKARKIGDLRLLATALAEAVAPHIHIKEIEEARRDAKEALALAERIGAGGIVGLALRASGEAAAAGGDLATAETHFKAAAGAFAKMGNDTGMAETYTRWGDAMLTAKNAKDAKARYAEALHLFEASDLKRRAAATRTSIVALAQ